jgi:hypothetical protein
MDLACDTPPKVKFEAVFVSDLWICVRNECMETSQLGIVILLLFGGGCLLV